MIAQARVMSAPRITQSGRVELAVALTENRLVLRQGNMNLLQLQSGDIVTLDLPQFRISYNIIR